MKKMLMIGLLLVGGIAYGLPRQRAAASECANRLKNLKKEVAVHAKERTAHRKEADDALDKLYRALEPCQCPEVKKHLDDFVKHNARAVEVNHKVYDAVKKA